MSELIESAEALLLDFDGPVCSVFAGHPANIVADKIRNFLASQEVPVSPSVMGTSDPMLLLRWVGSHHPTLVVLVEDILCAEEATAVLSATPTPYGHEVIRLADQSGRQVAIVSNNSAAAIMKYLAMHKLNNHVSRVIGRAYAEPHRMKPNPDSVISATKATNTAPNACVFVGDTATDIHAGQAAGVRTIGYAKREDRGPTLAEAGADTIISNMSDLLPGLMRKNDRNT
ncbi:HAD family hydrolase [Longimycelium tulufanense]|uniref:HAD family hydrolase n=1 Tax=Longimycelium tulufanense TaxID=907463 RepID=UPI001E367DDD|nr:HAD-IA family hydrolase [Longimycelium tulufanense]